MRKEETIVFEPGDVVLFQKDDKSYKNQIGIILKCKENGNYCLYTLSPMKPVVYTDVKLEWMQLYFPVCGMTVVIRLNGGRS